MIITKFYFNDGTDTTALYDNMQDAEQDAKSADVVSAEHLELKITGKSYKERKASAYNVAVNYSWLDTSGLSWNELSIIEDFFRTIGKRYGLLREFHENCIA